MWKAFRRVKTLYKVLGSFLFIAVLLTALGIQSITTLRSILTKSDGLYQNETRPIAYLMDISQNYQRTRSLVRDILLEEDSQKSTALVTELNGLYKKIDGIVKDISPLLESDEASLLTTIVAEMQKCRDLNQAAIDAKSAGQNGYQILTDYNAKNSAEVVQNSLNFLQSSLSMDAGYDNDNIKRLGNNGITALVIVLIVCDVLAVLMGFALTRMVVRPLKLTAAQIESLALGTDAANVDPSSMHGEFRLISENIQKLRDTLNEMYNGIVGLSEAATHGRLSTRADTGNMKGYYLDMVGGINQTLDAVINPINEATVVLGELSRGNLGVRVEGEYEGDHAIIKRALNTTIDTLRAHIGEVDTVLGRVAEGDLTNGIEEQFVGDFESLKVSINRIVGSLSTVLYDINLAAQQVASGTKQVSDGSQAISQGATEQASSIEELTASISSIAEQTRKNAVDAGRANEISVAARNDAVAGDGKMREMQRAMAEINESSANIEKIIKVIDDIAFQTNILALNAAVEAARAGIHGKGFAVVAEEVRNLAGKSAKAAKETSALIETSIKKAEAGTIIADETAQALSAIVSGMEQGVSLMGSIAAASNEQATAIAQVNKGIEQMSQVVQTNSATAEEAAAASEELSGQADLLKSMTGRFRLQKASEQEVQPGHASKRPVAEPQKHAAISLEANDFGKY